MQKITGKVIHGDGYGKKLGFPTANLELTSPSDSSTKDGIYAGYTFLDDERYLSGIVISHQGAKIETHLINFSGDLYGKEISLGLGQYIRSYREYDSEEELIAAIKDDIQAIKNLFDNTC